MLANLLNVINSSPRHCHRNPRDRSSRSNVYRGELAQEVLEVEQRGSSWTTAICVIFCQII